VESDNKRMKNSDSTNTALLEQTGSTLWQSIVDDIKSHIDREVLAPNDRLPSINALCQQYGVGTNTIRTALKELSLDGYVKSRPRSGFFVQSRSANNSTLNGNHVLAIILPRANHLFHGDIVQGAEAQCRALGYHLLIANTGLDPDVDAWHLERLAGQVAGMLVIPSNPSSNLATYASLRERNIPYIFIDRYVENASAALVATDNEESGRLITHHLLEYGEGPLFVLCAHSMQIISAHKERLKGYRRALQESGLAFDPARVLTSSLLDQEAGVALTRDLLKKFKPRAPFRIFALDECVAQGSYVVLKEAGLRIPEDVAVAGVDDTLAMFMDPPLTTIRQNLHEMGAAAVRQIVQAIDDGCFPTNSIRLQPQLMVRSSSTLNAEITSAHFTLAGRVPSLALA
jgi:DNA-binding LacI/PurR family transcriptional regulator